MFIPASMSRFKECYDENANANDSSKAIVVDVLEMTGESNGKSSDEGATTTVSAQPVNSKPIKTNGIIYSNEFYELLQKSIDEVSAFQKYNQISLDLYETPSNIINSSGNVKIHAIIPKDEKQAPNYCNIIVNNNLHKNGAINMILNTLTSENFVSSFPVDNLSVGQQLTNKYNSNVSYVANPVHNLVEMFEKNITSPTYAWNLNYNRNLDENKIKQITTHVFNQLNLIIEYVINNDLKTPNEEFRKLITDLFSSNGSVYDFAIYSLMLPALVNYVAGKGANTNTSHATRYIGIVGAGSGLFPKTGNIPFSNEIKWLPSDQELKIGAGSLCPYAIQ